jgi:plasmid stability protein
MTLTIDLPDEKTAALAARAKAQGLSAEQYARQVLEHDLEVGSVPVRRPLSEVIGEIWADMPAEVRAKLPRDGASQVDHYVYGLPKRDL